MKNIEVEDVRHLIDREFTSWDFLIIGKGDKGCSAIKSRGDLERISDNRVSFWISGCTKYCGMTIFKNTKEGIKLQKLIDENKSPVVIENYLSSITFKKLKNKKIFDWINAINGAWYEMGKKNKVEEIKQILNI